MRIPDGLTDSGIDIECTETPKGRKYSFKVNGAPCRVALNPNNSARAVAAYQAMLTDVHKIKSYLGLACEILEKRQTGLSINKFDAEDNELLICSSLYHTSVSLYGKCFKKAEGRNVKLEESKLKEMLPPELIEMHDRFHDLRDNWTGHGGDSDHEELIPVVLFYENIARPTFIASSTAITTPDEIRKLLLLCEPLIELITSHKEKNEKKALGKDHINFLNQLRSKAKSYIVLPKSETAIK